VISEVTLTYEQVKIIKKAVEIIKQGNMERIKNVNVINGLSRIIDQARGEKENEYVL